MQSSGGNDVMALGGGSERRRLCNTTSREVGCDAGRGRKERRGRRKERGWRWCALPANVGGSDGISVALPQHRVCWVRATGSACRATVREYQSAPQLSMQFPFFPSLVLTVVALVPAEERDISFFGFMRFMQRDTSDDLTSEPLCICLAICCTGAPKRHGTASRSAHTKGDGQQEAEKTSPNATRFPLGSRLRARAGVGRWAWRALHPI